MREVADDNWSLYLGETKKHEEYHDKYYKLKEDFDKLKEPVRFHDLSEQYPEDGGEE